MNPVRLAIRVLRVDGRTRTSTILTAVGVAVATGLVLLLVSLPYATKARAERSIWQVTNYGRSGSVMLVAGGTDFTGDKEITRLDVASTVDPGTIALPPGVPRFPRPGEVLVSPALFERMQALAPSQLADRFQGRVVGTLDERALTYPDQLVALVGHTPATMPDGAQPSTGFRSVDRAEVDPLLALLAGVGVVVLIVPSLVLVASSSRLTAARRERRLAALRLAGATPGQVTGIVAAETGVAAAAGALLGLAVSPVLDWLAAFVPWGGGTWLPSDFGLPVGMTVFLVVAMPALVLAAAVLGLRRVVRNPIGAVSSHAPKPLRAWRLLALPIAGAFFFIVISTRSSSMTMVLLGLLLVVGSAVVVGPWITYAVGRIFVQRWRKPAGLLAGRRLLDDPRGAYRASAGVVLAVFIGSMALILLPSFEGMAGGGGTFRDEVLSVSTSPQRAGEVAARTNERLARYGQRARAVEVGEVTLSSVNGSQLQAVVVPCGQVSQLFRIELSCAPGPAVYGVGDLSGYKVSPGYGEPGVPFAAGTQDRVMRPLDSDVSVDAIIDPAALPAGFVPSQAEVAVTTAGSDPDTVRTALAASGESIYSRDIYLVHQQAQLGDLRRVTVIGLVAAAVLAGCSAAIATAGSVMDRRRTFGALMAAGTPVRILSRALRAEAALPALAATIGAGVTGMLVGLGLFSLAQKGREGVSAVLTPWLLAPVVLGLGVAVLAASVCTPALNRVRAEPLADE
ncbi:FtsX-like permease family protein [Amycolatopsis alkalitolerans]|uniref:FtsX-like permease family protein n=1 Tax=Amycolatopsis alkalitolerans TaxID=2547244 RepID=A0A5C4M4P0_9PSEU|nr:FtsX-like permease family protein [Amycolatopsis alkalitolerans]TNC26180.1 FtsX-like permease family protein [Amycolatopsis alkalitolerans]